MKADRGEGGDRNKGERRVKLDSERRRSLE